MKETAPVYVTKSFAPPEEDFQKYVHRIFESLQFTNNGSLLLELTEKLRVFLGVRHLQFVTNGTLAIQLALRELDITEGEIITTPFTYVATTSAILWEHCEPVYVDIDPRTLCLDPNQIEAAITPKTKAILPVHVFGIPCDVDAIGEIGRQHGIPVVYDASHAFGCVYKGKSLLDYGDISTCSFHATKLFHTIEGGCVICQDEAVYSKIHLAKQFGHRYDDHFQLGINAKASEFQAAMGLCNLPYVPEIIADRKRSVEHYDAELGGRLRRPEIPTDAEYNYAYYPVIFPSEETLLRVYDALETENIHFRRYFYPSLNTLPYLPRKQSCPISEDISLRIACLPLYYGMRSEDIRGIATLINTELG